MRLGPVPQSRGAQRQLPAADQGVLSREWKENIGRDRVALKIVVHITVIQEVVAACPERINVHRPSLVRHTHAEMILRVSLSPQRDNLLWVRGTIRRVYNCE